MRKLEEVYADLSDLAKKLNDNSLYMLVYEIKEILSDEDEKKAAKDWVKGTGEIRFNPKQAITVNAYRNKKFPGVIIHRNYDITGELLPGWSISHELSGLRLSSGYQNMRKAVKAFTEHAANVDWNRPGDEITADPEARDAYNRLSAAK